MLPPFDIFRIEDNGEVVWIRSADDLKTARVAVEKLMAASPHEHIIHSDKTNNDLVIKPPMAKRRAKPASFQMPSDRQLLASRAALLTSPGFSLTSRLGTEAARAALAKAQEYALCIIAHSAPTKARKEITDWPKAKTSKVAILAL